MNTHTLEEAARLEKVISYEFVPSLPVPQFWAYNRVLIACFVDHGGQALNTGQVPAEFAMPKPDTNMAEASEEAEKMDTDGQNQESEADGQKQDDESTPIQEVVHPCIFILFHIWRKHPLVFSNNIALALHFYISAGLKACGQGCIPRGHYLS